MSDESNMNTSMKKKTKKEKKRTSSMVFLYLMIVNICGGLFLSYWLYKYHPTNSNLWMVPLGLLSFITPAFLSFSVLISDLCDDDDDEVNLDLNQITNYKEESIFVLGVVMLSTAFDYYW